MKSFQNLPICRIIFCSLPHKAILTKHTEQFRNAGMSIFSCLQEKITCDRSVELVYLRILGEENNFFYFANPFLCGSILLYYMLSQIYQRCLCNIYKNSCISVVKWNMYVVPTIPKISSLDRVNVGQENFRSKPLRVTVSRAQLSPFNERRIFTISYTFQPEKSSL